MKADDPRWLWLIYGLLFVPFVGPLVLVLGSSGLYYRWRPKWPDAAARLNRHAWIAIGLNITAHVIATHFR